MNAAALIRLVSAATLLALAAPAAATDYPASDDATYARDDAWLCRPGRDDACAGPTSVVVVKPDGSTAMKDWRYAVAPPVDCFYVYPTVSKDANEVSGLVATPDETRAARQQFAPFASLETVG